MIPVTEQPQDELSQRMNKMLKLKLSQLKKLAQKSGVPPEVVDAAVGEDEDDTKSMLVSLLFKAACMKARPPASPMRKRQQPEMSEDDLCCSLCVGCIRVPFHEGPCMDAQCNEIYPEPEIERAAEPQWAEEMARHKAMTEEIQRKLGEEAARKAKKEAQEKAQRKLAEEENRKKEEARQQKAAEEARKLAEEENCKKEEEKLAEEARKKEEEEAQQKLAEEVQQRAAAFARQQEEEEEAQQKLAEEETRKNKEEALAEEARKKAAEARRAAEEEEMMAMDVQCVDAFLQCTMTRVKTPIKGSNLYTKHIRPCRPAGTSVDVKDSSFRNLGTFLNFLEEEGLLRLVPGLSDPVVNQIRYEVCRNYEYIPRPHATETVASDSSHRFQ